MITMRGIIGEGKKMDDFTWSQSEGDVFVSLLIPFGTKSSDISVVCTEESLTVKACNMPTPLLHGRLHNSVRYRQTIWLVVDDSSLEINLFKYDPVTWPSLFTRQEDLSIMHESAVVEAHLKKGELAEGEGVPTSFYSRLLVEKMIHTSCYHVYISPSIPLSITTGGKVEMQVSNDCRKVPLCVPHMYVSSLSHLY